MKLDSCLTPYTKINSKRIKDFNIRPETLKILEENVGSRLLDIGLGNNFLDLKPKAKTTKTKINNWGTSLVAQWLRILLPMQGTWVRSLVQEDPTCCGATKPVSHNYWACTLEPLSRNYWAHTSQLLKPACLEPVLRGRRSHRSEKPMCHNKE